jgi:intracellular sulfur oxidation DsrE/DsrF family protein
MALEEQMDGDQMTAMAQRGLTRRGALMGIGGSVAATAFARQGQHAIAAQDATPGAAPETPADFKVVLHAAEEQNWQYVLSNLNNLTEEWPEARLRVVVDGSAVLNLQGGNSITNELTKLAAAGVEVQVCPNALKEHQIDPATIPTYAQTTMGGVVALVMAQRDGFVYVKP